MTKRGGSLVLGDIVAIQSVDSTPDEVPTRPLSPNPQQLRNHPVRVASGIADERLALLSRETFSGVSARTPDDEMRAALAEQFGSALRQGVLSPVGVVNLFRQYFFEFDTFLGPPAGQR